MCRITFTTWSIVNAPAPLAAGSFTLTTVELLWFARVFEFVTGCPP